MKKIVIVILVILLIVIGCFLVINIKDDTNTIDENEIELNQNEEYIVNRIQDENMTSNNIDEENNIQKNSSQESEQMKVSINNKEYDVELDDNETTRDILANMPLELNLVRYAGHEYYSELPFTPKFDENRTSNIKAGHIYYWDGWNAFVINFEDYDIDPYKVVHRGEITDKSVVELLENGENNISVKVTE